MKYRAVPMTEINIYNRDSWVFRGIGKKVLEIY